ncbi:MAG TPA: S16 family serine protease, partial [Candidatus Binatia bacterium]|nr:S16 family serine protease [Candidatus Binatia bacterium]
GDSASSSELYAILSSLSEIPIKQGIAVTGSVNQNGEVQAIGGVNQKIEGHYDVCRLKGLTGAQGVMIPRANVRNLMLRPDVVEAVKAGKFRVYAVSTIDEGIEVLTGVLAGTRDGTGNYTEGSVNDRVEQKLRQFTEQQKKLAASLNNQRNSSAIAD